MMNKVKFALGNHTMVGEFDTGFINSRYEEGKSAAFNEKNGGFTYKFSVLAVDTAEYISVYMEIDSKSLRECGEFISDDEYQALMKQRVALRPKCESVELPDFGLGSDDE